jgi:hypothetical protein
MRKPVVYLALAAMAATLVAPASAATRPASKLPKAKPLVVKDATGDANGLNSQGGLLPDPGAQATPVQDAGSDIVSFTLTRKDDGRKVTALVAKMTLAAAPAADRNFRIRMSSPECSTYFLEYDTSSALGAGANLRNACGDATGATFSPIDAVVSGSTITWTVPVKGLPGDVKLGTPLTVQGAQVSVETAVIIPGLDEVLTDATFKVGQ